MANTNTPALIVSQESIEQRVPHATDLNMNMLQPPTQQVQNSLHGPVAIFWDIENCPVPSDVRPEDVGGNIRMALRVHPVIKGAVIVFSAYGDFNAFPRRLREGCQRTGVKLIDVPNGRKDAADKAILVDIFLFALDHPPPSYIMLISGDVDFAPALHVLGQRGYSVILVIPSGVGVSSALCNAGKFVWDWPSVAHGEGFVPPTKALIPPRRPAEVGGYLMGFNDNLGGQNEEEAILYSGLSQRYYNSGDLSTMSQCLAECNVTSSTTTMPYYSAGLRSQSLPSGLNEIPAGPISSIDQDESMLWVQPGDLNGLKGQLVKLLELSGGSLLLARIPAEYQKFFGRPLYISEFGASKLVNLFQKMSDTMTVEGEGPRKFVCLRNWKSNPAAPPVDLSRKDKNGNVCAGASSSDGERGVGDEQDERRSLERCETSDHSLEQFKYELQDILVSYSCQIFLGCFEAIYQQRYKKPLDYQRFGVDQLEDLFDKLRDIVILYEEPVSKKKFLSAAGGQKSYNC